MLKISKMFFFVGLLILTQVSLISQNSTNSPYTRYGYGAIADRSFGAGRSMGGVGYGLRSSKQINPMNPASYTSMDSLTFLFDAGISAHLSWFDDGVNKQKNTNGNLDYVAMQFPLSRQLAMSVGLLPYSSVGYSFYTMGEGGVSYSDKFYGTGGLNEVYVGLSIDIWKKRLALGANVSYLFGDISHRSNTDLSITGANDIYTMKKVNIHNMKYDFGAHYTHPLSKTERFTFGLVYSPKINLRTTSYNQVALDEYFIYMIEADTAHNRGFSIPNSYGIGGSYTKDNKMILAADLSYQEWSQAHFFDAKDEFKNRIKVAVGGEFIPNNFTRSYLNRVRYRAGFHYSNSYLQIKDAGYNEYGVSLGFGLPMMDNRSFINASFEYVKVVPGTKMLINEQYLRFTISYTFNEYWFFKRKMD